MTGSLIYKRGILYFTSLLKFPEEDVFLAPRLVDIILKMTGSPKYEHGIWVFSSPFKFPKEDVF